MLAVGVSGTGSEKILTRAMSPAVMKIVLSSCANCSVISDEVQEAHIRIHTAIEPTERSQPWVIVNRTSFLRS